MLEFGSENSGLVQFSEFLVANPLDRPGKFQECFMKLQVGLYEQVAQMQVLAGSAGSSGKDECESMFQLVARAVRAVLPCTWLVVTSMVCTVAVEGILFPMDLEEQVQVLFPGFPSGHQSVAEKFLGLRTTYILDLLGTLWNDKSKSSLVMTPVDVQELATADVLCAFATTRGQAGVHDRFWEVFCVQYFLEAPQVKDSIKEAELQAQPRVKSDKFAGTTATAPAAAAAAEAAAPAAPARAVPAKPTVALVTPAAAAAPAAGEDHESEKQIILVSFKDIQVDLFLECAETQAGITPTPAILKKLCSSLESHLYGISTPGMVGGDVGHTHLYQDKQKLQGKEAGVCYTNEGNVMLQFYGRITLLPVVGSIHLC